MPQDLDTVSRYAVTHNSVNARRALGAVDTKMQFMLFVMRQRRSPQLRGASMAQKLTFNQPSAERPDQLKFALARSYEAVLDCAIRVSDHTNTVKRRLEVASSQPPA